MSATLPSRRRRRRIRGGSDPGGEDSADAESMLNAATLLGLPPAGDFQLSARITVDGCTVTFDDIRFTRQRLADLRDGS